MIFQKGTAKVLTDPPAPADRRLSLTVTPPDALCVLTPRGDHPVGSFTAQGTGHQTFTIPGSVPAWGADLVISAPGYQTYTAWTEVYPTDTELPAAALDPVDVFTPAPRSYSGNMCGIYIPGLPAVPGGSSNPALCLSWFYGRYADEWRARIRAEHKQRGFSDFLLSWPDERAVGCTPERFRDLCRELVRDGLIPCVMLYSKDYDPSDAPSIQARMAEILPAITKVAPRICVGWELSIALSPQTVQTLIDWLAPQVVPWGGKLYVHFQQGYASFDYDGPNASFAGFWNRNIGKLTGLLHQRVQDGPDTWNEAMYQARITDILERFAGGYNCSPDSGFGHPFDLICLEITAMDAFNRNLSEAEQNRWGQVAIQTPAVNGVRVIGSGNGA